MDFNNHKHVVCNRFGWSPAYQATSLTPCSVCIPLFFSSHSIDDLITLPEDADDMDFSIALNFNNIHKHILDPIWNLEKNIFPINCVGLFYSINHIWCAFQYQFIEKDLMLIKLLKINRKKNRIVIKNKSKLMPNILWALFNNRFSVHLIKSS